MKCLHPLGMSCASCKSDARVATYTLAETITQPYIYRYVDVEIAIATATKREQERIIKLLEERYAENVDHCEWGTHVFLDNAIALIKGENK